VPEEHQWFDFTLGLYLPFFGAFNAFADTPGVARGAAVHFHHTRFRREHPYSVIRCDIMHGGLRPMRLLFLRETDSLYHPADPAMDHVVVESLYRILKTPLSKLHEIILN